MGIECAEVNLLQEDTKEMFDENDPLLNGVETVEEEAEGRAEVEEARFSFVFLYSFKTAF